jgi:PAS domain S-box-containing protein
MTVKRHNKPGVSGKQRLQRPPVETMVKSVDRSVRDEQSEQEQCLDEGAERQLLADELRISEQRFRITFEQAPVGMAHVGLDGRWLLVNQKLCALMGYTQEELLERTFHAVMLPEDLSMAFAHAQSMIAGDLQTYMQELRFLCKDGSQIWVNLTVSLARDSAGMPLSFLAVTEDLTDRKQAAQQHQLNQLKDQFIVNVNHELRTPLTEVYGYLELLTEYQEQLDFETQAQFLVRAKEGCQELILLINNVLDALAFTEKVQPPQCELIAVAPLVDDVLEHLDPHKQEADRLHLAIPEQVMVWANGQLLRQVLRNLLSNAFKYCPKPAAVIIHATQIDPGAQSPGSAPQVCLCVQDAGPGIPPEELPLLFQKFVRLQRDLSGTVQGSGLGLYISRHFVEAMQGRLWAESTGIAGQGSRFYVTLPCHPQAQNDGYVSDLML